MKGKRERIDLGEGRWEKLGEVDGGETVVGGVLYARRIYFQEIKQSKQANKETKPRSSKGPEFCVTALGTWTCTCKHIDNLKIAKTHSAFNRCRLEIKANVF